MVVCLIGGHITRLICHAMHIHVNIDGRNIWHIIIIRETGEEVVEIERPHRWKYNESKVCLDNHEWDLFTNLSAVAA